MESALPLTFFLSEELTTWCSSELEESQQELQALVTLTQRQVDVGAQSAQGVQERRQ